MRKQNKNVIYGFHSVQSLLESAPENILELYFLSGRQDQRLNAVTELAKQHGIQIKPLSRDALDRFVNDGQHQGIVAVCNNKVNLIEDVETLLAELTEPPFLLILDGVTDPHNLGACLRTANAAGVHAVIAPKDRAVGLTSVVRKVASGAAEITPFIAVTNLARTLQYLQEQGIWIYGTAEEATESLYECNFSGGMAIVLGSEGGGLRRLTREHCDKLISIPTQGEIQSLNVSVAAGVCLFEAVRQRKKLGR